MSNNILVLAAHPDDELLGCGGTIALHALSGDRVFAAIICEGESVRYGVNAVGQKNDTKKAAEIIGLHEVRAFGFPDQGLDTIRLTEVIQPIEQMIDEISPSVIYCQYGGDINIDHEILFKAALVAARPTEVCIDAIYAFDTASSTEWAYPRSFVPDTWVDVSKTIDTKIKAMACYKSEVRDYPHPRSLEALKNRAKAWGNQVCMDYAEVFMTVRRVCRSGKTSL